LWVLAWVLVAATPAAAPAAEGLFVRVPNPITSDAVTAIKRQVNARLDVPAEDARRPSKVVFDFNPGDKPAATGEFGVCRDLAAFIKTVQQRGAGTVAFVHGKVSGHTVLPVLACQDLVMGKDASLGEIAGPGVEPVQAPDEAAYRFYFGKDDRFPLVRKMYDPAVELRWGIGKGDPAIAGKKVYIDARTEKDKVAGVPVPVDRVQDAAVALYTTRMARDVGLAVATADTRTEVAELYGLMSGVRDDPIEGRNPEPFVWTLTGEVDGAMRESLGRVLKDIRRRGGNVLILVPNVGGNDLPAARALADDLIKAQADPDHPLQVIGFIPETAGAAATVVALGCTDIVMSRPKPGTDGEEAVIGDFEAYLKTARPEDAAANLASIKELAANQQYPPVLIDGMFKKDIEILRVTGKADQRLRRFMTRDEFERNKADWAEGPTVKPKGQLLKLTASQAAEYGLARLTVEGTDVREVTAAYGYPPAKNPDPGWLDRFAEFLRLPVVTVLLVVIGFTGLILELKVPGLTVPGILAALCFILVFWAHSRFSGQTFVLALLLFLLGLVLIGIELFVLPGFGAAGIFGILCMLAGLALVTLDRIPETGAEWGGLGLRVSQYLFAFMGAIALAIFIARFLPKLPGANRLVLNAPADAGSPAEDLPGAGEAAELLGAIGTTNTALRPAGVVRFGDKFVDVVSDGGFVPAGTRVQVILVEGTRIVVKEV
jgi:membrane-bound ClpP family serine protease